MTLTTQPSYNYRQLHWQLRNEHITDEMIREDTALKLRFKLPRVEFHPLDRLPDTKEGYIAKFKKELYKQQQRLIAKRAFLTANPQVKLRTRRFALVPCAHNLRNGYDCPSYGRSYDCDARINYGVYTDHNEVYKAWGPANGAFVIGHPYNKPEPEKYPEHVLPDGIQAVILPPKYSWYQPGWTTLTILGRPDVIETLNLNYDVPDYVFEQQEAP